MKKILLIAVLMLTACAVQAASFKWSAANIYDHTGTAKYTGSVSLYVYESTAAASTAVVVSTVTASSTGAVAATTFSNDSLEAGKNYNFFFVINDGEYTFTSSEKANVAALDTQTQNVAFGNMTTATQSSSNWKSSGDVPEPTTGLLVLLGMAGLALKRKVA